MSRRRSRDASPSRLLSPSLVMSKNDRETPSHLTTERTTTRYRRLVEIMGLEPTTYGLQSRRSSQLSYIPSSMLLQIKKDGIERGRHCCLGEVAARLRHAKSSGRLAAPSAFARRDHDDPCVVFIDPARRPLITRDQAPFLAERR